MVDEGLDQFMLDFIDGDLVIILSKECIDDLSTLGSDLEERIREMSGEAE
jgi:hypothetical protein